jgi:predicted amidohydrolase
MVTRVASLQLEFQYFNTPQEFANHMRAAAEAAAAAGAQLILAPHSVSFGLFGIFDFDAAPNDSLDALAQRRNVSTRAWLQERAMYVYELYLHVFQSLAARVETWLVPGTVLEPDGDGFFVTACVFNPAGEVVARQRQMHRPAQAIAWGVKQGDALNVVKTERGDLGLVLGEDIRYPETARALTLLGADVLLHPAAYASGTVAPPFPLSDEQFLQDLWREVQANQTFGVQANLVGENLRGHSAIYAPVELTDDKRGILAQAQDNTAQILLADLDFEKLDAVRRAYPILDLRNPGMDAQIAPPQDN